LSTSSLDMSWCNFRGDENTVMLCYTRFSLDLSCWGFRPLRLLQYTLKVDVACIKKLNRGNVCGKSFIIQFIEWMSMISNHKIGQLPSGHYRWRLSHPCQINRTMLINEALDSSAILFCVTNRVHCTRTSFVIADTTIRRTDNCQRWQYDPFLTTSSCLQGTALPAGVPATG